jgi:hypothetical protein
MPEADPQPGPPEINLMPVRETFGANIISIKKAIGTAGVNRPISSNRMRYEGGVKGCIGSCTACDEQVKGTIKKRKYIPSPMQETQSQHQLQRP